MTSFFGALWIEPSLFGHVNSLAFLAPWCLKSPAYYKLISIKLSLLTPWALFLSILNQVLTKDTFK